MQSILRSEADLQRGLDLFVDWSIESRGGVDNLFSIELLDASSAREDADLAIAAGAAFFATASGTQPPNSPCVAVPVRARNRSAFSKPPFGSYSY